jgi:hypothetical protein
MIKYNLSNFYKGWIIGAFEPSIFKTDDFEIGIKKYRKNDVEPMHYHKEAVEYTIIIEGVVKMNDVIYKKDDIIEVQLWETIRFECLEDAVTIVIKTPSVKGDKYIV